MWLIVIFKELSEQRKILSKSRIGAPIRLWKLVTEAWVAPLGSLLESCGQLSPEEPYSGHLFNPCRVRTGLWGGEATSKDLMRALWIHPHLGRTLTVLITWGSLWNVMLLELRWKWVCPTQRKQWHSAAKLQCISQAIQEFQGLKGQLHPRVGDLGLTDQARGSYPQLNSLH